jgi:hypothetical protein
MRSSEPGMTSWLQSLRPVRRVAELWSFDTLRNSMHIRKKNLWLCLPLAVTGLGDGFLTLVGSSIGWENNPAWRWWLHRGALAFGLAFAGYLAVVGLIVAFAPLRLSKVLCITMVLAHTHGIVSWLMVAGVPYFSESLVYASTAIITVVAVEQSGCTERRDDSAVSSATLLARRR